MTDRDRLIKLIDDFVFGTQIVINNLEWTSETVKELADHLLVSGMILPKYKVGDRVWYITGIHGAIVKSAIVDEIIINCNGVSDLFATSDTVSFENSVDIFYPTKEEAERVLKEREKNGV